MKVFGNPRLIVACVVINLLLLAYLISMIQSKRDAITDVALTNTPTPSDCVQYLEGDNIGKLPQSIINNPEAYQLLKDRCLYPSITESFDVTGDGIDELIFSTVNIGCVSCHAQYVLIFQGENLIFDKLSDDPIIRKTDLTTGFALKEPLRQADQPMCCPEEGIVTTYKYSVSGDIHFYKYDQRSEKY